VLPVGITPEGQWVLVKGEPAALQAALQIRGRELPAVDGAAGEPVTLPGDPTIGGLVPLGAAGPVDLLGAVDVVFPVLHGPCGEDGTIQGLLEMAGVPYVGSGVLASAAGMDKEFTKKLLAAEGLPVGHFAVLRPGRETLTAEEREELGLPVFVKPARAGSSVGISKVSDWEDLDAAIDLARRSDPKVIVETAVTGREVECGVLESLDGGEPEVSVPAEIRLVRGHEWYDFEAKYLDDACEFDIPAPLPDDVTARLREAARRAFVALDCAGLARVDFFVTADGGVVLNEVNTMPGFTPISMFPRTWEATGLSYPDLVDRLVRTALRRGSGLR
jgi:D-alanine-D-alanine ligase